MDGWLNVCKDIVECARAIAEPLGLNGIFCYGASSVRLCRVLVARGPLQSVSCYSGLSLPQILLLHYYTGCYLTDFLSESGASLAWLGLCREVSELLNMLKTRVCVCTCMYVCIYIYIYMYICTVMLYVCADTSIRHMNNQKVYTCTCTLLYAAAQKKLEPTPS